jgi:hypothetical protein
MSWQNMAASAIFSNSQALRAIGQSLEFLGMRSFELEKQGKDCILRVMGNEAPNETVEKSFLQLISGVIWGPRDSNNPPSQTGKLVGAFRYSCADIFWLEAQGTSRRGRANAVTNTQKLSQALRVIGEHLDRKKARDYTVSMPGQSVLIVYQTSSGYESRESFTEENLSNLGVSMLALRSGKTRRAM